MQTGQAFGSSNLATPFGDMLAQEDECKATKIVTGSGPIRARMKSDNAMRDSELEGICYRSCNAVPNIASKPR